jgi:hypothetical protein
VRLQNCTGNGLKNECVELPILCCRESVGPYMNQN